MKQQIRLSAVSSLLNDLPEEASPYCDKFDRHAARAYVDGNVGKMAKFLHEAGRMGSDLVCTYEDFHGIGTYLRHTEDRSIFVSLCESIPGPTSEAFGKIAKQYKMMIAANYYERDREAIYNTTVLIDQQGQLIGKYRKVHLPASEKWLVTAGTQIPVFETDIGNIGIATCFDITFTEHCRCLALNGANIILYPTAGKGVNCVSSPELGDALLRVRAAENGCYLVAAKNIRHGRLGKTCIVSNAGEFIGEWLDTNEGIASAVIEPDCDIVREDMFDTLLSGVASVKARHFLEREPALYTRITDGHPPVAEAYRQRNYRLRLEPEYVAEASKQWGEYQEAVIGKKPNPLKYHWGDGR